MSATVISSLGQVTPADELFAALDGQVVSVGDQHWQIRIWGIHPDHTRLWLQVGFLGPEPYAGTIAVEPGRAADALSAFVAWRQSPEGMGAFRPLTRPVAAD